MDTIKCECGFEILLLPDVKTMGNAIEAHVTQHIRKLKPSASAAEAESLRDALIVQVFSKLSKLENDVTWGCKQIGGESAIKR
jgi:hypothetical protein